MCFPGPQRNHHANSCGPGRTHIGHNRLWSGAISLRPARKKPYRIAWDGLLSVKRGIPDWVIAFSNTYVGVATPSRIVRLNGADYRLAFVCKPHDCAGNELKVLFGPGGNPAWALLTHNDKKRWLGNPDEQIRRTITELSTSDEDSEEGL